MPKVKNKDGLSVSSKVAILCCIIGVPLLFFGLSAGLSKLASISPYILLVLFCLVATVYTARTSSLLYDFYEYEAPIIRFIPCLCELSLIDAGLRVYCYILYILSLLFMCATQLPYNILRFLGEPFALSSGFYFMIISIVFLLVIQIIKGFGLSKIFKDVEEDWYKKQHTDIGSIGKMVIFGYLPFVRILTIYALNKPLDTLVRFMGSSADSAEEIEFVEE